MRQFFMLTLASLWQHIQRQLFPVLTEEIGSLSVRDRRFVEIISLMPVDRFLARYEWSGRGRPPYERVFLFHAFIAQKVYQLANIKALHLALKDQPTLRRLCGWENSYEIPDYTTFTRAFAEFAQGGLADQLHEAMVKAHCSHLVGHVSRDSTAIVVAEKIAPKIESVAKPAGKAGRPKKGQKKEPKTRLEIQATRSLAENMADLPCRCDVGCKTDSKGYKTWWRGYKLHLDVIDGDIPVSAVLTSASLHDSQVAIPLAQQTVQRVHSLYDLMDAAYDSKVIRNFSMELGHVPIIEPKKTQNFIPLDFAQRQRFAERTSTERVNSRLKEQFGGRNVRVRGATKVMAHLMFGILVITALGIWQRIQ